MSNNRASSYSQNDPQGREAMNADYLPLVIEEAAEVIQAATKVQRFGPDRRYPSGDHAGETNTDALAMEIGDLLEVIDRLRLPTEIIERGRAKKRAQLEKWGPQRTDSELDAGLAELRAFDSPECICGADQAGWVTHNAGCPAASVKERSRT